MTIEETINSLELLQAEWHKPLLYSEAIDKAVEVLKKQRSKNRLGLMKMTCKDCLHFNVCGASEKLTLNFFPCNLFQNKSLFIELPCKVGDTVYRIEYDGEYTEKPNYDNGIVDFVVKEIAISDVGVEFKNNYEDMYTENELLEKLGEDWFLTKEEAEKALKERKQK